MTDHEDSLVRCVSVPAPPDAAWRTFVDRFADWWPRAYSFSQDALETIGIEAVPGGRCFERDRDGRVLAWGTVVTAEAPHRLVFLWQITADRRIEPDTARASEVAVRFEAAGSGTQIILTHRAFSRHGGDGRADRDGMASDQGWTYGLRCFADAAGGPGGGGARSRA
ncbi:hypothetical protein CKO28_08805 [Rhodovibrio sodomensis]|uniref:Activator of Hsp90 ATPase homologue 1/2-like C-terminal domain-containing protein n=1 Tax=Rhodovibrio sodomensis TaxID=1088 RepID=A0ABS1DE22_9PROT|nr:SRPBCC family protein [Rhodovibrio sodomensis]MBK1668134.1 hypothetical protein [Rhodovibrio sodomensis]